MSIESIITVAHDEITGSPTEEFPKEGGFKATRVLQCAWENRLALAQQLRGGYSTDGTGTWVLPHRYPWRQTARCTDVTIGPKGGTRGLDTSIGEEGNRYEYAYVTAIYGTGESSFATEAETKLLTHRIEGGAQFITRSAKGWFWWTETEVEVQADDAPGILVPILRWSVTIHEVETLSALLWQYMGTVNDRPVSADYLPDSTFAFLAETCRYDAPQMERTITTEGENRWNVTLQFSITYGTARAVDADDTDGLGTKITWSGWNHFPQPPYALRERMWDSAAARDKSNIFKPYVPTNLNTLFAALL